MVYASSFIVLHSKGSSLQNRIRTFSHALLFDNVQFLGEDFSERFFFYSLMKRCFGLNYVNYSGEELKKAIGKGMPDYYLGYRNRVFVFGCKDVQIAAKMKLSGDYETIKKQFLRSMSQIPRGIRKRVAVGKYDWQKDGSSVKWIDISHKLYIKSWYYVSL